MRHTTYLFILFIGLLVLSSCTDNLVESVNGYAPKGNPVDAYLSLSVGDLDIDVATRATADEIEDTEAERRVNDLWVFQYDATKETLIDKPIYIEITSQEELIDLPVTLSDNNGEPCIIYVVTNSGSNTWGSSTTTFGTLDALKRQTISNAAPLRIDNEGGETEATLSIPMGGSVGEDESLTITQNSRIEVPVKRMFAKMYVHVAILKDEEETEDIKASLTSFYIERIASTSTVATIYNQDGSWYTPEATRYEVSRYFSAESYTGTTDENTGATTYGPFVLYVPENIQGEAKDVSAAPANALRLTTVISVKMGEDDVVLTSSPSYVARPGSWNATLDNQEYGENFNINRNTIYDIQINISVREDDLITPSANCIIAPPGVTTAFYPYVRDEEPSAEMMADDEWTTDLQERYDFTTYLDPSDASKVIRGLKIIWQTQDCIGDNSNYDLVWMDPVPDENLTSAEMAYAERHRKIYVKPAKIGNAVIAAYNNANCTGDILWSWHIWATDLPIEEDAIEYYHYSWDSTNGINTSQFVAGPLVMMCNLGALSEKPSTAGTPDFDTYGMLYQWGRKDPFPPMKVTNDHLATTGQKLGPFYYNYADYSLSYTSSGETYNLTVTIGVYDNSNKQISLVGNDGSLDVKGKYVFDTNAPSNVPGGDITQNDNDIINYSIKHPTTFLAAQTKNDENDDHKSVIDYYYNEGDWLTKGDDFLWGGGHPGEGEYQVYNADNDNNVAYLQNDYGPNKQIFDPCPYGWRVSSGEIWLGLTIDGMNWHYTSDAQKYFDDINCADANMSTVCRQNGYTFYMQGWRGSMGKATSFFPTQGSRIQSGQPYNKCAVCGNYHNATVDEPITLSSWNGKYIRRVDILHLHCEKDGDYGLVDIFTNDMYYYNKAVAGPLRCVRDTK